MRVAVFTVEVEDPISHLQKDRVPECFRQADEYVRTAHGRH